MNTIVQSNIIEKRTLLSTCSRCGINFEYILSEIILFDSKGKINSTKKIGVTKCPKCHV